MNRIIRLDEVSVGEVMTPRMDMTAIPINATIQEVQDIMLDTGHLRIPVYEETVDNITGILVARDVWRASHSGIQDLNRLIRNVPFAPASKPVEDLIPEMRAERVKMAIVVDEFGGTAGLVTLEDLIEEIVGEIQDEHESDEPIPFQKKEDGSLQVWGGVSLRDAIARLGFTLMPDEEEGYDTIGGLVFGRLNRLPLLGDTVKVDGGILQVAKVRGRRIEYLLFLPDDEQTFSLS
ncbi:MAG: hemolysin family protein [Gemmatimonadota bacterium]|nr:hemolysin family protein [Gemmatimonadota bacterium]